MFHLLPYNVIISKGKFLKSKNCKINFGGSAVVMPLKIILGVHIKFAFSEMVIIMCSVTIEIETVIRGCHVYKEIWTAPSGEILYCP